VVSCNGSVETVDAAPIPRTAVLVHRGLSMPRCSVTLTRSTVDDLDQLVNDQPDAFGVRIVLLEVSASVRARIVRATIARAQVNRAQREPSK
jgi:hypothetical protein